MFTLVFVLPGTHIDTATLPKFEPVALLELSIPGADRVRMQVKTAGQFPGTGQALPGSKFAADNGQHDLSGQLLPNADIALPREPELHGRP